MKSQILYSAISVTCASLVSLGALAAQNPPPYNPPYMLASALNLQKLLAPPPAATSSQGKSDLAGVLKAQAARSDLDCTRARAEVNETFAVFFGPPYGPLTNAEVASYSAFMDKLWDDSGFFASQAKGLYTRQRPYIADPKDVHPCTGIERATSNSFPSGHATEATMTAEILGAIDPARKDIFLARAEQIAKDRVLTGMHYPTDIKAGTLLGESIFQALQKSASFQKDLQAVKAQGLPPSTPAKKAAAPEKSTSIDEPNLNGKSADCREWLSQHICIINEGDGLSPTHNCLNDADALDKVRSFLLPVYDNLPAEFQKMFCSIPMTYINPSPNAGNFNTVYEDATTGDKMVFLSLADRNLPGPNAPATQGTTGGWIEGQVNWVFYSTLPTDPKLLPITAFFGTSSSQVDHKVTLPTSTPIDEETYFGVVHELGHIFDHLNGINPVPKITGCKWSAFPSGLNEKCSVIPNTFSSIAWLNQTESIFDSAFPDRALFIDYFNGMDPGDKTHKLQPADPNTKLEEMLEGLYKKTSFMSGLGAAQAYDDWAESCVFYVLFSHFQLADHVSVITPAGSIYDLTEKFLNNDDGPQSFAAKRKYLQKFFARTDLNYPQPKILEQFFPAAKK